MREKLQSPASTWDSLHDMRRRILALLATVLAVALAALFALGGAGGDTGTLLGPRIAATATATPMPATQLVGLPGPVITNGSAPLIVRLSGAVAPTSPPPTFTPSVAGSWSVSGEDEVFTPVSTLLPCSSYTMTVWGQTEATAHAQLGRRHTVHLTVACPPLAGLQQALARLGYLGATFRPLYDVHYRSGRETRHEAAEHAFRPPHGMLAPDPSNAPPAHMGQLDATTRGALEVYQADNGLEATGEPNRATWLSLLFDVSVDKRDPQPYTWVQVSESLPETLWVHRGHQVAFSTPVNTGVAGAETQQGIFPIYSRLVSTTMAGEDPDGTKYDVPDVPWVNYFNGGDAVHGYPREAYGFPQSNGCVELPIEAAHTVFGMLAIGDIVWVQ
jgi:L,D-transpeptidase catalytic domain/Putative peptidoglycan binding domain